MYSDTLCVVIRILGAVMEKLQPHIWYIWMVYLQQLDDRMLELREEEIELTILILNLTK